MKHFVETNRLDENKLSVVNDNGLDIKLFANTEVPIDRASLRETVGISAIGKSFDDLRLQDGFQDMSLERVVLTPDFHKGSGIPVGTVLDVRGAIIPKCIGRDINCSMRYIATDLPADVIRSAGRELDMRLRAIFFGGLRNVAMDESLREAIMRHGLAGISPGMLQNHAEGLWNDVSWDSLEHDMKHTHNQGSWHTHDLWIFDDFVRGAGGMSRDSALGSIGGGNHFVEFQEVDHVADRHSGYNWGLTKGHLGIMIHSGSLFAGGMVGDHYMDVARKLWPSNMERPNHDFYPLPLHGKHSVHAKRYLSALGLASNFAVINRMLMGYMAIKAIKDVVGIDFNHHLVYDLSHNMLFENENGYIHRKGSSPSENSEHFVDGHPVIIPGSMGTHSYIMRGGNLNDALNSAPHGAGRLLSRGKTRSSERSEKLRIVTKVDTTGLRSDVKKEVLKDLMEEAPDAYKPILPAYETVSNSGMAHPVARLSPILTVKG